MNPKMVPEANHLSFGDRIQMLLGDETASGFARRAGLSQTTFNNVLRGKSDPTKRTLELIARAANVSFDWLISGNGDFKKDREDKEEKRIEEIRKQEEFLLSLNEREFPINDTDNIPFDDLKDHFIDIINVMMKRKTPRNLKILIEETQDFKVRLERELYKLLNP